jgi:SHS2 domain-containing protein
MIHSGSSPLAGFEEVEHMADRAYRVWGRTLEELFIQAAQGLYRLADVQLSLHSQMIELEIELKGPDYESLLVAWLNELLYLHESHALGFNEFQISQLDPNFLKARVGGAVVRHWGKMIKAATYNNLIIHPTDTGLEATLVLDV